MATPEQVAEISDEPFQSSPPELVLIQGGASNKDNQETIDDGKPLPETVQKVTRSAFNGMDMRLAYMPGPGCWNHVSNANFWSTRGLRKD